MNDGNDKRATYSQIHAYIEKNPDSTTQEVADHFRVPKGRMGRSLQWMRVSGYLVSECEGKGKLCICRWRSTDRTPSTMKDPDVIDRNRERILALFEGGKELRRKDIDVMLGDSLTSSQVDTLMKHFREEGTLEYHVNRRTWRVPR